MNTTILTCGFEYNVFLRVKVISFVRSIVQVVFLAAAATYFPANHVNAQPEGHEAAGLYNEAGSLYHDGRFQDALALYEKLLSQGIRNPDLYYNASNASYRYGNFGKAVLYLERSLRLAPSDRDARANLDFLESLKQDGELPDGNIVVDFLSAHYNAVTVNRAAWWSGLSFALTMLLAVGVLYTRSWKRKIVLASMIASFLIFACSTGMLVHKINHEHSLVEAVVMTREADAYSGPGKDNTHIFTIHEGTKVVLERSQGEWSLIRLKSGAGGWIISENLERI